MATTTTATIQASRELDTHCFSDRLSDRFQDFLQSARKTAVRAEQQTECLIRRQPTVALSAAALAGGLAGFLFSRR